MTTPATTDEPLLISLAGVADLAGVRRPVASMWRTRSQRTDAPFPDVIARRGGRDFFDARAVACWLVDTGHGHNPEAIEDAAAFSDGVDIDFSDPADVAELASLIALRAQAGVELVSAGDLAALAAAIDPDDSFVRREVERHLARDTTWTSYADQLIDAAYSPDAALALVHKRATRSQRAHASAGSLGADARDLATTLVQALATQTWTTTVRIAPGVDAQLFDALMRRFDGDVDIVWAAKTEARPLRRANACRGIPIDTAVALEPLVTLARVPVAPGASIEKMLTAVDEFGLTLKPDDEAVLIGPARALTDALPAAQAAARADTLRTGRVRGIIRLGAGHVTSAAREALSVWVFGPAADIPLADRVIALADLTDVALTAAAIDDAVSDILANLGGPAHARAHAFRFARLQRTSSALARSGALVTDASARRPFSAPASRDLPALLDAALDSAGDDAPVFEAIPQPSVLPQPRTTSLDAAVKGGHARVIAGTRIAADAFGDSGLVVVTADDLDDPAGMGAHRIDHLAFADAHPNAQLTRPGDVIFRTSVRPRAWVDHEGSHVVAYPARVLRITAADPGGLVPELVAADIARGASGPAAWRRWRVRTIDPAQMKPLRAALAAASTTCDELRQRIARLDGLVEVLADAVSARAVALSAAVVEPAAKPRAETATDTVRPTR